MKLAQDIIIKPIITEVKGTFKLLSKYLDENFLKLYTKKLSRHSIFTLAI